MKKLLLILLCLPMLFSSCKKEDESPANTNNNNSGNNTNLSIGDFHQGGIIFYLDGNVGGLICDIQDLGTAEWGCYGTVISGADGTAIGTGYQNTVDIVNANCSPYSTGNLIAANLCSNSIAQGFSDWFLPSKDELNQMYLNKSYINITAIANGGSTFTDWYYWSSSEAYSGTNVDAWGQEFDDFGTIDDGNKNDADNVRSIRAF